VSLTESLGKAQALSQGASQSVNELREQVCCRPIPAPFRHLRAVGSPTAVPHGGAGDAAGSLVRNRSHPKYGALKFLSVTAISCFSRNTLMSSVP
jgi:hypothetical protein